MKHVYHRIAVALVGLAVALALTGTASAELKKNAIEVGPYLNYTMWDSNADLKDDYGYGLWVGWHIAKGHEVEFNYEWTSPDVDLNNGPGADVTAWMFGYIYNFKGGKKLMP